MRSFYAKQESIVYAGGWLSVLNWARTAIKKDPTPIQLLTARGGEKCARVIAEISPDGERMVNSGRIIALKVLSG